MNKLVKKLSVGIIGLTLCGAVLPTVNSVNVFADENSEYNLNKRVLSETEKDELIEYIKQKYPSLSDYYIKDTLMRQLQGDYTLRPDPFQNTNGISFRFAGIWDEKGITVEAMGAAIDIAIGALLTGGINSFSSIGRHERISVVKRALKQILGSKATFVPIEFFLNLYAPGYAIAKYWDDHDKYPSNGHINFEW